MTRLERGTRYAIAKFLNQQGYPRYADIFMKYELHFHNPRRPFAAMVDTDKGIIYINPTIDDKETLSVLIRHEILHIYLAHQKRILQHFAKQKGLKWTEFDDIPLEALMNMSDEEIIARYYKELGTNVSTYFKSSPSFSNLLSITFIYTSPFRTTGYIFMLI